mmetsp:Transcript_13289/g.24932  ORF Transcript_13289/g.24932 Transcript_13289/m.24932 type:complete len:513 (-) Transcript_13289:5035-6573(-)
MEFSETCELLRMIQVKRGNDNKNPFNSKQIWTTEGVEKILEFADTIEECFEFSPPSSLMGILYAANRELLDQVGRQEVNPVVLSPEEIEDKKQVEAQNIEANDQSFEVEIDQDYAASYIMTLKQPSMLTSSLMKEDTQLFLGDNFRTVKVYLFRTRNSLVVTVKKSSTIEQMVPKIMSAYMRSEHQKTRPLRYPSHADAYEIWMVEDDSHLPETDFTVDRSMKLKNLLVDALAFCEKEDYEPSEHPRQTQMLETVSEISNGVALRVLFNASWSVLSLEKDFTLREVLGLIEKKFPDLGYLKPENYQFRINVQLDDEIQQVEECVLDMNLPVSALGTNEVKLSRRPYIDEPTQPVAESRRREARLPSEDEVKFDPQRFHMTKAQACAYKEFEVIKVNRRGKRQRRVLGIDQLRIYNMTKDQAKQLIKQKSSPTSRQVMLKKLQGLFYSITHHPEIPIPNVVSVKQDESKPQCFILEYREGHSNKHKLYETDSSANSAEIVAKISKLIQLVSSR